MFATKTKIQVQVLIRINKKILKTNKRKNKIIRKITIAKTKEIEMTIIVSENKIKILALNRITIRTNNKLTDIHSVQLMKSRVNKDHQEI